MTCIVGIEVKEKNGLGKVVIGGDTQGSSWSHKATYTQPKVFEKNGIVFGYTTSYRFGQLIEHALRDMATPKGDVYAWLVQVLVPSIRAALTDGGWEGGGTCIIGARGEVWTLQDDFSVLRSTCGYSAVGSGCEYALGCLAGLTEAKKPKTVDDHSDIVKKAIEAAGMFSPTVGMNSTVVVL